MSRNRNAQQFIAALSVKIAAKYAARQRRLIAKLITMTRPDHKDPTTPRPNLLIFHGVFCIFAKSHRPLDVSLVVSSSINPTDSSRSGAVIVPNDTGTSRHAPDVAGLEVSSDLLRTREFIGNFLQWTISLRLMGSLLVIMRSELVKNPAEALVIEEPVSADTFTFNCSHPALRECVQIRAVGLSGYQFHASASDDIFPPSAELGFAIVNEVFAFELSEPAILTGDLARDLIVLRHNSSQHFLSDLQLIFGLDNAA